MPWPHLSCWGARPTTAVPPVTSPVPVTRVQALLTGGRSPCLRGEALQKYLLLLSTSSSSLVSFEHLTVHPLITQSSLQFICSSFRTAFNHKMHWSQNEACDWQAYTCLCLHRFAHNRHSPHPAERQMVAEGGSSGKSTPSWPRVEDSSDRPPSGQTTLHSWWIIEGEEAKCKMSEREGRRRSMRKHCRSEWMS